MIPTPRAIKVLLIDSNVYFAKRLGDALKREGFEVTTSTQAAYALTALEYGFPFTVVGLTSRQNSGLTSGFATTSGFEIEYFGKKPKPKPPATMPAPIITIAAIDGFAIDAAGINTLSTTSLNSQ